MDSEQKRWAKFKETGIMISQCGHAVSGYGEECDCMPLEEYSSDQAESDDDASTEEESDNNASTEEESNDNMSTEEESDDDSSTEESEDG